MPGAENDGRELFQRFVEKMIDYQVVEFPVMLDLAYGIPHAALDIPIIIAPPLQSLFQGRKGRGKDKDIDGILDNGTYLLRSLPIDLQDDVLSARQLILHPGVRRAVKMIKNGSVLQERVLLKQGLKFVFTDKK